MPLKDRQERYKYQEQWRVKRRREWMLQNGPCVICESWEDLELDHENPLTKVSHRIWNWRKERRELELRKCRPMCHNCHLEKTKRDLREMDTAKHLRISDPPGKAWCYAGKHFTDFSNFTKNCKSRRGLQYECRECRSKVRSPRRRAWDADTVGRASL